MSVGRKRHSIMPRHFLQTAELAGVGSPFMRTIFEDLADTAFKLTEATVMSLLRGFPEQLVTSVLRGIKERTRLFADHLIGS